MAEDARPYPKVGDIVRYKGKWAGDLDFGEVRQLRFVEQTGKWRAYVLPLTDIGEDQYVRKKNRKSAAEDVEDLRPVRAFYVRSVDGFKVMKDSVKKEPRYISDGYKLDDFQLPKPVVDPVKFATDLQTYEVLKARILMDTATFGAVGTALALVFTGTDRGLLFGLGAAAAVAYVILLEKNADDVASGAQDNLSKLRGDARFLMPVLVVLLVALKNYLAHPEAAQFLNLIPKDEFFASILGFVAPSRLPLLYRELRGSIRGEEVLDMMPGSVGQGRKMLKDMRKEEAGGADNGVLGTDTVNVIVVSGPRCLGKTRLVEDILEEDPRLSKPPWCTTRPARGSDVDGEVFNFMEPLRFEQLQRAGSFLQTCQDQDGESYGLRVTDVLALSDKGKTCIIDADRTLVEQLMKVPEISLIGVWVSLDSMEAIQARTRLTLLTRGAKEGPDLDSQVRLLCKQAIDDIEFGVTSGVFEFTIINHDVEESLTSLRKAVQFATG
ncbi:unnamed protein product [Discosporangium mesarthrocarpum]